MKVAFLVEHLDSRRGGMERSATEFLAEVAALDVEIHAVTQTVSPDFSIVPSHVLGVGGIGRAGKYRTFVDRAQSLLSSGSWDVIHSVTPCWNCDIYQPRSGTMKESLDRTVAVRKTVIAKQLRRIGARLDAKHRLLCKLENQLLSRTPPPVFAALSRYMQRQTIERYGVPEKQTRVIFNGVNVNLPSLEERQKIRAQVRAELGLSSDALVAIFVGHNFRRKGLSRLLEAIASRESEPWHLLVLGKDSPQAYQKQARQLGIDLRARFLGSRKDVQALYLASDVGILPTYYDPCARTVLEGLSLGLPYITTVYDGSADAITNGKNGYVLSSPDSVSELIRYFNELRSEQLRREMAKNALLLRQNLTMRRHAEEMVSLYNEIARTKSLLPPSGKEKSISRQF